MAVSDQQAPGLILYGGAFNPPHMGHVHCASVALKSFPDAELMVLPGYQPAGAFGAHKMPTTPFESRVAMCRLAFSPLAARGYQVKVSPLEKELSSPNYTLNTVLKVRSHRPGLPIAFLMGGDQWEQFPAWHEPLKILRECFIIVIPRHRAEERRPGISETLAWLQRSGLSAQKEDLSCGQHALVRLPDTGTGLYFLQANPIKASSSDIRQQQLRKGLLSGACLPPDSGGQFLLPAVRHYIEHHQLYEGGESLPGKQEADYEPGTGQGCCRGSQK